MKFGSNPVEDVMILFIIPILVIMIFTVLAYIVKKEDKGLLKVINAEFALIETILFVKVFLVGFLYGKEPEITEMVLIAVIIPAIIVTARGSGDA